MTDGGRTSVVTGVSRGLGAALTRLLFGRGDRVVGIGRRFTAEQREWAAADPDRVVLRETDLARPETVPDATEFRQMLAGGTDLALIHNAGVVEPIGAVGAVAPDRLVTAVTVNLTAPMLLTNAFLAALPAEATATILFLSSGAAHRVVRGWAPYGATKRGGEAFFEAVAAQVADDPRITVASMNPGVMDTDMQAEIRRAAAGEQWFPDRDRFVGLHERGELPDPAEVAGRIIVEHLTRG